MPLAWACAGSWIPGTRPGMTPSGCRLLALRFFCFALELLAAVGQLLVLGLHEEGVEAAALLDGLQGLRADAHAQLALERVADQRHLAQVWPEGALGLVLGMAAQLS